MATILSHYLASIKVNLRLDNSSEAEIISELEAHVQDKIEELKQVGLSEEEASKTCIKLLGSAKVVTRQIHETHSQGTWRQAMLASTPHLLFALLFALDWWHSIGWLSIAIVLITGIALYGWSNGKPAWFFPWFGYSLLPVVIAGLLLLYLPKEWSWLALLVYIPLASILLIFVAIQSIKRDWLYGSLILLPAPIIIGWFLALQSGAKFADFSLDSISHFAPWIGGTFLALAAIVTTFIRLRQRWLKGAVLLTAGLLILTLVTYYPYGKFSSPNFLILVSVTVGLFLAPALLERRIKYGKHNQQQGEIACRR